MRVRLRNGYARAYAQIFQHTHTHKAVIGRVEAEKLLSRRRQPNYRQDVKTNTPEHAPTTPVSTQEEADTLMILHGIEVVATPQDTDLFVLILKRLIQLGKNTRTVKGTSSNRRRVALFPIYEQLGPEKAAGLPGFYSQTGCDITGHINGVGKKTAFKVYLKSPPHVVQALSKLGEGELPSFDTKTGCEEFLCYLLGTKKVSAKTASDLRWKWFKSLPSNQLVDKLPPTSSWGIESTYTSCPSSGKNMDPGSCHPSSNL